MPDTSSLFVGQLGIILTVLVCAGAVTGGFLKIVLPEFRAWREEQAERVDRLRQDVADLTSENKDQTLALAFLRETAATSVTTMDILRESEQRCVETVEKQTATINGLTEQVVAMTQELIDVKLQLVEAKTSSAWHKGEGEGQTRATQQFLDAQAKPGPLAGTDAAPVHVVITQPDGEPVPVELATTPLPVMEVIGPHDPAKQ